MKQKMARTTTTAIKSEGLFQDLQPSVHIHKRFGREITVKYHIDRHISKCTLANETRIEEGSREDYRELVQFHCRQDGHPPIRKVFKMIDR